MALAKPAERPALSAVEQLRVDDEEAGHHTLAIDIVDKTSLFLAVSGVHVVHATLILGDTRIAYVFPPEEYNTEERYVLDFFGNGNRLHMKLIDYSAKIEFTYKETQAYPSLHCGYGAEVDWDGRDEVVEDVTVRDVQNVPIDAEFVYRKGYCGLRKKQ